jgi:hypothetical protein
VEPCHHFFFPLFSFLLFSLALFVALSVFFSFRQRPYKSWDGTGKPWYDEAAYSAQSKLVAYSRLSKPCRRLWAAPQRKRYNKAKEEMREARKFFTHNSGMLRTLEVVVNGVGPPRSLIRQSGSSFSGFHTERQPAT